MSDVTDDKAKAYYENNKRAKDPPWEDLKSLGQQFVRDMMRYFPEEFPDPKKELEKSASVRKKKS